MRIMKLKATNWTTKEGNPDGGSVIGDGFVISWQKSAQDVPGNDTGAMLIDVLASVIDRLEFYQTTEFACDENAVAIFWLRSAHFCTYLTTFGLTLYHWIDDDTGKPDGGLSYGRGFTILWQRGTLRNEDGTLEQQNGAFVTHVIEAIINRMTYLNNLYSNRDTEKDQDEAHKWFASIQCVQKAAASLDKRVRDREDRGVLGTHNI